MHTRSMAGGSESRALGIVCDCRATTYCTATVRMVCMRFCSIRLDVLSDPQQASGWATEPRQEGMFGSVEKGIIPVVPYAALERASKQASNRPTERQGRQAGERTASRQAGRQVSGQTDSCPAEPTSIHKRDSNLMSAIFISIQLHR